MSSGEITVALALLILLMAIGVIVSWRIRARRRLDQDLQRRHAEIPVPDSAWRRFCSALAAPYARAEWTAPSGQPRFNTADQTYFGYGCMLPHNTVLGLLRVDWGIRDSVQAQGELERVVSAISVEAARIYALRGGTASSFEEAASLVEVHGAPRQVTVDFVSLVREKVVHVNGPVGDSSGFDAPGLAFDIARVANLIRWSVVVGFIDLDQAERFSDILGICAGAVFDGWEEFSDAYVQGLKTHFKGESAPYLVAITWLKSDPASPWKSQEWVGIA